MKTKSSPAAQSAASDDTLFAEWRRLCMLNKCDATTLDEDEAALREMGAREFRPRLVLAISRLKEIVE